MIELPVVDGLDLDAERRAALKPGGVVIGSDGVRRRLPRYFYEIESARRARATALAEHFTLNEFVNVDVREARALLAWPRYVPCGVTLLAAHLEVFRLKAGGTVHLAANGGYRSPAHRRAHGAHCWATAADIFMIGGERLEEPVAVARWAALAASVLPGAHVRAEFDHLHVDLGCVSGEGDHG